MKSNEHELVVFAYNLHMAHRLASDLTAEQMSQQIGGVGQTPAWILGHLAIATDYASQLLGRPKSLDNSWHTAFGPGSEINHPQTPTNDKAVLLDALARGHKVVVDAASQTDLSSLTSPHPVPLFEGTPIVSCGHLVSHLLTGHEGYHLGQLSAWRRQKGFPALF